MPGITSQLSTALADRYKIERHIGEGGMATVYLAHDLKHDRKVALKVLRPELAAVIGAQRFLNEIKVTANLQHPHILPLHDSGDADNFLFYVMPYIEDDTLREKLDREKQLGIEEALDITKGIAAALDYAHRQGVIHRDIKPANILMHEGQPMIADFGIALAVSQASDQRLTETGLSLGTPHYMSPEQAMGDSEPDARSDVYSLGAMLYEMLAGEPPYTGSSAQAIVAKVITSKPVPLRDIRDTVPMHVDAAIAQALHKMPADRFSTASAFADALANPGFTIPSTMAMPSAEPTVSPRSGRSMALAAAAALALLAIGFLGGRFGPAEPAPAVVRFDVQIPEGVTEISECCGHQEALSPDGQWLVFSGAGDAGRTLYRRRLGRLETEQIPGTEGATGPFFSPDARWLGFHANEQLRKVPIDGGPPVPITERERVDGASWGDNDVIVFATPDTLYTVPGSGGTATPVPGTGGRGYILPSMLPGGEAAVMRPAFEGTPDEEARMVVVDLTTGAADTLGFGTRVAYASGFIVFSASDGTLQAQPFDPARRATTGQATVILDGMRLAGPRIGEFALSKQGDLAYQTGSPSTEQALVITDPNGTTEVPMPASVGLTDPTFSPDGRRIALTIADEERADVWIWDRDQQTRVRLTSGRASNFRPVWTKDGARIAFTSAMESGSTQLYWRPSDGSGSAERLLALDFNTFPFSWSPDGETLAVSMFRDRNWDVGLLTPGDSIPRSL